MSHKQNLIARAKRKLLRVIPGGKKKPAPQAPKVIKEKIRVKELVLPQDGAMSSAGVNELDRLSLLDRFALPPLARMSSHDQKEFVEPLLSIKRMKELHLDPRNFEFPEANIKLICDEAYKNTALPAQEVSTVEFHGSTTGELSRFLEQHAGDAVHVAATTLLLDETIVVPSKTALYGHNVRLVPDEPGANKAILLDSVADVVVEGFVIDDCCEYPFYVKHSQRFVIAHNRLSRCRAKAICVMGQNKHFILRENHISDTGNGAIFLHGVVEKGVIEQNVIERVGGVWNFSGGIVFSALDIQNIDTAYNPWQKVYLPTRVEAPHDIVIRHNVIRNTASNGLYSHAGYCNYIVANVIESNNKEGMCLDYGTCGTYVAHNTICNNGGRFGMDERQLQDDFIQDFGIMADGSSPAKVPGISLDNASYNIIYQNEVSHNYGTGIKMVRAGARNVILCNEISDNNVGTNDTFHFFGVELSTDLRPDYDPGEVQELDFAPCFENIIARNIISGDHYSGVFLGQEAYINDVFDNIIGEAKNPVECISSKLNSIVNNSVI